MESRAFTPSTRDCFPLRLGISRPCAYHALVLAPDLALSRWQHVPDPNIERFVGIDLTRHTFGRVVVAMVDV